MTSRSIVTVRLNDGRSATGSLNVVVLALTSDDEGSRSSTAAWPLLAATLTTTLTLFTPPPDLHAQSQSGAVVRPGIEEFLANVPASLNGKRVGLITNHSAIDRQRVPDIDLIAGHKDLKLVALLAPEHGIRGTDGRRRQDRRRGRSEDRRADPFTSTKPRTTGRRRRCCVDVDVLIYDLVEVGGRTWT